MTQSEQKRPVSERLKDLWHEGMVRHVLMRKGDHVPMNVPLNLVVLGTLLAPWLVAIGAIVGLVKGYSVEMHRDPESATADANATDPAEGDPPNEPPVSNDDI